MNYVSYYAERYNLAIPSDQWIPGVDNTAARIALMAGVVAITVIWTAKQCYSCYKVCRDVRDFQRRVLEEDRTFEQLEIGTKIPTPPAA